jgi:hypothetical protein
MSDSLFISQGRLHAPHFIFVRGDGRYSDADLLRRFGLSSYRPTKSPRWRYAILGDDGQWTMIADDWLYTLWHMPSTRFALEALKWECDVFACSVGEDDESFDFVYYQGSRRVREYVVTDPYYRGGKVAKNKGKRLPGEAAAFRKTDGLRIVLGVAASLGIRTDYTEGDIRAYAPPECDKG